MTKAEYQKMYYKIFGTHLRKQFWKEYREVIMYYPADCLKYFISVKGQEFMKQHEEAKVNEVTLGNCKAATPPTPDYFGETEVYKQQGNNPMRIENTSATAYVTATKSDDAISRDYLLSRLAFYEGWRNPKMDELSEFFNLSEDGRPKTYLQLIDAIKNDKFSLDDKAVKRLKYLQDSLDTDEDDADSIDEYGYGPFYGLIFTGLPKADRKGYNAAVKELEALTKATKDAIMVKSPADGLAALQAFEAWMPTGKAN